jgi:hypothetical protein
MAEDVAERPIALAVPGLVEKAEMAERVELRALLAGFARDAVIVEGVHGAGNHRARRELVRQLLGESRARHGVGQHVAELVGFRVGPRHVIGAAHPRPGADRVRHADLIARGPGRRRHHCFRALDDGAVLGVLRAGLRCGGERRRGECGRQRGHAWCVFHGVLPLCLDCPAGKSLLRADEASSGSARQSWVRPDGRSCLRVQRRLIHGAGESAQFSRWPFGAIVIAVPHHRHNIV